MVPFWKTEIFDVADKVDIYVSYSVLERLSLNKKYFDCVNHGILFHKLEIYDVTGTARELFSQSLSTRPQRVNLDAGILHTALH
jgi:hypothetical protein